MREPPGEIYLQILIVVTAGGAFALSVGIMGSMQIVGDPCKIPSLPGDLRTVQYCKACFRSKIVNALY